MSPGNIITSAITLAVLLCLSAFFSSSETAIMAINRYRLRHLAKQNHASAKRVQRLLERPDRLLSLILIGNTLVNILASSIATVIAVHLFGDLGVAIATGILTMTILIFAETVPKTIAALYPQRLSFIVVWPLSVLLWLFYPLVWLMNSLVIRLLLLCRIRVKKRQFDHLTSEELYTLLYETSSVMPSQNRDMLLRLLELEKISVEDIMAPRHEIVGINVDDEWEEITAILANPPHSRLPLYHGNIDQLVGILEVQKLLPLLVNQELNHERLLQHVSPPSFALESTPLNKQLIKFQQERCYYAIVVDEYGTIQGFITLEDILEEIVGEFILDIDTMHIDIYPQKDGGYLIDGTTTLRELNKVMKWQLPTDGPKTLSGLITEQLEMLPQTGIGLKINGYRIEIKQVKANKVKIAYIMPPPVNKPLENERE
ncbi:MAG: HlyC/CorC family transporter [Gammaproteobacteria bacterium]|nr:HlyC/CorC family transporter [Gammaproteobacteria bacterium]